MSNELMIPEMNDIPAYVLNPELAKQANDDAAAGISTGFAARVKLNGKAFALVDGNGEETAIKAGEMTIAPDGNSYLPIVVLRAKRELQKAWYAGAYNPDADGQAPDCFSNDGMMPDASVSVKQCDSCAACPMNAFGSGKDQAGNATKGKACSDSKILAIFVKGAVHKMKLPPASLKNWGLFVKQLSTRGIPVGNVKVLAGFDEKASFPVLTFQFGGFLSEAHLPKLAELAASSESEEIVNDTITASTKAIPAKTTEAKPAAKVTPKVEPKIEIVPDPVVEVADDLGLGDLGLGGAEPAKAAAVEPEVVVEVASSPSDDDLAAELGL